MGDPLTPLSGWTDAEVASALFSMLWRWQDAGGVSGGRSLDNRVLEAVQALLDLPRPAGDVSEWPPLEDVLREAERRHRVRALSRMMERYHSE